MDEILGRFLSLLFTLTVFALIIVYGFACLFLTQKGARKALGSLITGVGKSTCRVAARLLKIAIMFVINFTTMIIRVAGRPDQAQNAWAVFVERMSDVILGA